jgi:hypothetical protein
MGWKYEVTVWVKDDQGSYSHKQIYAGENLFKALYHVLTGQKKHSSGCATLNIR